MMLKNSFFAGVLTSFLMGCSSIPQTSSSKWIGYKETGKASYYGTKHQFRKTASGERFDQYSKTAAHKRLPFGAKVKVTNSRNGKSVIVKINDRGPFTKERIIDLSRSAFSSIADIEEGVINVEIEFIES